MDLKGIISISGRPGLHKVLAQNKNNVIVESLIDGKKFPAYASDRISSLDDISVYTTDDDLPLKEVLNKVLEKEEGKACMSHKEDFTKLQNYLVGIIPNLDLDRVYPSDIKKIFQWYNLLLSNGIISLAKTDSAVEEEKEDTSSKKVSKTTPKSKTVKSAGSTVPKSGSKTSGAKKAAAVKTGSTRGK